MSGLFGAFQKNPRALFRQLREFRKIEFERTPLNKVLFTGRLKLVPVETKNCDLVLSMLRNDKIKKYLCDNNDVDKETVEQIIKGSELLFEEKDVGLWLIHDLEEGAVIGYCGFFNDHVLELIYVIHPDFQNKGFATEAFLKSNPLFIPKPQRRFIR